MFVKFSNAGAVTANLKLEVLKMRAKRCGVGSDRLSEEVWLYSIGKVPWLAGLGPSSWPSGRLQKIVGIILKRLPFLETS